MKRWMRLVLQILSVLLFLVILWWAGPEPWEQILRGKWGPILTALCLHTFATLISAVRLKLITETTSRQPRLFSLIRYYQINIFARALGIILPRNLSGVGGKAAGLNRLGISLRRSLWIVLIDNAFDILVLAALGIPAFLYLTRAISLTIFGLLSLIALLVLACLLWVGAYPSRATFILKKLAQIKWLAKRLKLGEVEAGSLIPPQKTALAALGWSILLNLVLGLSYYWMGQAVSIKASWDTYLACYPLAQLSLIIALAPGGLGIFDLGWLGLLQFTGVSESAALTYVVAQRAYVTIFVVLLAGMGLLTSLVPLKEKPLN